MPTETTPKDTGFIRELGVFDSVMIVVGVMIGSGIFIVPADMARNVGSAGWLLGAWLITAILTVAAALSYGELSSMMPQAGGMYVYLREAFSPIVGFLYGWTLFTVIQTGTIAAVAVAFARYTGVLIPGIAEDHYIIAPIIVFNGPAVSHALALIGLHRIVISTSYAISLSTGQLVAILVVILLTWTNSLGVRYGKILQNLFTTAKIASLAGLILLGLIFANHAALVANFSNLWTPHDVSPITATLNALTSFGLFAAICVSQSGSLFAADSWHDITFAGGEVKDPEKTMPRALALGTICVTGLFFLANVAYLCILPLSAIQHAPSDRVATAMLQVIFPSFGAVIMSLAIMVSTFGCINGLVLAGPRVSYSMAQDGMFPKAAGRLNKAAVPAWSLWIQGLWSALLVLPRTVSPTGGYGNLYSNLLDWVISAALLFYVLAIAGVIRLRFTRPNAPRPFKTPGYPLVPLLYIVSGIAILYCLFAYRASTTWPGLVIVLLGVPVYYLMKSRAT